MKIIESEIQLTKDMIRYEKETGKKAIWHGRITEGYKKWKKGEKIYDIDKKGINILVSEETKVKWEKFAEENNFSTISKLIRKSVSFHIDYVLNHKSVRDISEISFKLKQPLTAIQGFLHLIIENESDDIKPHILKRLEEIYAQSLHLENILDDFSSDVIEERVPYDILIVEDDSSTSRFLIERFQSKGYSCLSVLTGEKGLKELEKYSPKLILLDIILPDINGFEICKQIKSNQKTKNIPVYFITAMTESKTHIKIEETGANGYFLKPFKLEEFDVLIKYLSI